MTMRPFILFILSLVTAMPLTLSAQRIIEITGGSCNFSGAAPPEKLEVNDPTPESRKVLTEILNAAGLKQQPFTMLVSKNVKNARATKQNGVRYIFYSQEFMEKFKMDALTRWAAYFLLAHEVGHHALKHDFEVKDKVTRHQFELQADTFATRVLFQLGAKYNEVLAGIKTFDDEGESNTHPDKETRMDEIAVAYTTLSARIPVSVTSQVTGVGTAATKGFPLELDGRCFKYKPNLIQQATAEIDDEKITITFKYPPQLQNRRFKVCLISNDANVRPEARTPRSIQGTGINLAYEANPSITWNYQMDRFIKGEAGKPRMLRLYVFDMYDLPNPSSAGPEMAYGAMGLAGIGLTVYGAVEMGNGLKIYDNEFKATGADSDYNRADKKYVRGQYLIGGGIALMAVSAILLNKEIKQNKEARKAICFEWKNARLEPLLTTSLRSIDAGICLKF